MVNGHFCKHIQIPRRELGTSGVEASKAPPALKLPPPALELPPPALVNARGPPAQPPALGPTLLVEMSQMWVPLGLVQGCRPR